MPGSMHTDGTKELDVILAKLGAEAQNIASGALFEGARVVADAYAAAVDSIKTEPRTHGEDRTRKRRPTPEEKESLKKTGIARFNKNGGEVNTLVGVAEGYTNLKGRKKAIKLLARSINHGTNFMQEQPVFRKASNKSRSAAQDAMVAKAEELINKIAK